MTPRKRQPGSTDVDALLKSANALMGIAARSVIQVEDRVTSPQLRVLVFLAAEGTQNLGAIAEELRVHPSNATRTCDKLLKADLITRSEDPADRRFVQLDLAPAGRELVESVLASRRKALSEVLDRIPDDARAVVLEGFSTFADAAGASHADGRFLLHLSTS